MAKISTMISVWLWGGIFFFLYLYFKSRKEIKKAGLDSIHLCILFFICCLVGLPVALKEFFDFGGKEESDDEDISDKEESEDDCDEVIVEYLENIRDEIDSFLKFIGK